MLAGFIGVLVLASLELGVPAVVLLIVLFLVWAVPEIDPSRNSTPRVHRPDDGDDELSPPVL